ncbi:uncharacterized protein FFB20_15136 [Fusarium fujikuroi]|nr:uncharacterized protein Y057_2762 [Fusarium fujikuroi]KLP17856.1 uncharacterized protein LW94_3556 [Fusarium fujikuroi]SCN90479.1 uncharacterized protein FFE2_06974 [Fusarium fujikuroi]SCO17079.1 uncharacterized protein FFB20_15136 [Fusarium fujikuroi]SCO19056.1 uncharacterized protein FFC1_13431 [Fusarium fujikuroi]
MTYYCTDCDKLFYAGRKARDQHCQVTGHASPVFECDSCSDCFEDEYDRHQHMNLEQHWHRNAPECQLCGDIAVTQAEIREHEIEQHFHCADCNRQFMNANCLRMHLNSKLHRVSAVKCPFCGATCNTATGLSHHLEQGSCPRVPMDRNKLYRYIKNRDHRSLTTNKELAWYGEKTYTINPAAAWNPWSKAFECYLCHKLHMTLTGLKKHLESPRHQQSLYHCVKRSCGKEFKTLAALINHLERFSCSYYHGSRYADYHQQFSGSHIPTQLSNPMRQRGQHYYSVPGVTCPFCSARYSSASGVVHHLEQGACPNVPLNRGTLRQEARGRDPNAAIYNRVLVWRQTVYYQATADVYNTHYGQYECYFCGALFRQLSSLNQHLASPRHQQELYYWPIGTLSWSNHQYFGTGYYQ